jgi:transcription antitermination factor NusA-like protein
VGDLLMRHVPALARGDLEIVAIARRPTVLTKVAVRRRAGTRLSKRPISLVLGVGADHVRRVRAELGNEQVHVVQWHREPGRYIAEALGLAYMPPVTLFEVSRRAEVLLGDIDYRGVRGWQAVNLLLASALTEWRIRLRRIATSPAWRSIDAAREQGRSVPAEVMSRLPKGLSVSIYGLHALLPTGQVRGIRRGTPADLVAAHLLQLIGEHIQVVPLRLDPDAGRIYVSERIPAERQLALPLRPHDL